MLVAGVSIYPTDDLVWMKVDSEKIEKGDYIIVKMDDVEEESGKVKKLFSEDVFKKTYPNYAISDKTYFLRVASELDIQKIKANKQRIKEAIIECNKRIKEHDIDMHLVTAHFSFLGKQVMFIFTAEGRVDFRNLVKDLAKTFKKQIRLKQIGPRDRAKFIGGYGKCGRKLCCSTFLESLDSVTMDMARVQNLHSKGSSKISGVCGKLLCCLGYEVEIYEELKKGLPKIGAKVKYEKKEYEVSSIDVLNQLIRIENKDLVEIVPVEKIKVLSS